MAKPNNRKRNLPAKKYTNDEVRDLMSTKYVIQDNPEYVLKQLGEFMSRMDNNEPTPEKDKGIADEVVGRAVSVLNLETHFLVSIATKEDYRPFTIEFANQLIAEYDCKTASEKALAQLTAQAYIRSIQYARSLNNAVAIGEAKPSLNTFFSIMSKEIDRANRQYTSGLTTLKQLKSPNLTVNVKTNAAFIAQNQQLNANQSEPNRETN